ncbi:hypothetical protein MFRU_008g02690 [Monilinia fructicola]|uniref:Uncharacterized protein n=1 Tax=Monilinia fructicola TaxID=38448 RepID=A0A5M9J7S0_MONFR|nr:hypothetical protein EYC84_010657 [Monilinia fructicola]KAG4031916.1 hypothetical protein MFRU_008g02690 [Monilinia fructicola]
MDDSMSLRGLRDYAAWYFNHTVRVKGEPFLAAFPLTIPEGEDYQVHSDPEESYGRITIPLLVQDDIFCRENPNWDIFQDYIYHIERLIYDCAPYLKDYLERTDPHPQGRTRTDYAAALEICQRPVPPDQRAIPLSRRAHNMNCFSHLRISKSVSLRRPRQLTLDTETNKACGPYVVIIPYGNWGGNKGEDYERGGRIIVEPNIDKPLEVAQPFAIRKEHQFFNTPIKTDRYRYQFEFFMPHLPEHNSEEFERGAASPFVEAKIIFHSAIPP